MIESPAAALASAGVPLREDSLTEDDCVRLVKVVARLREFLAGSARPQVFRFEDVFDVREDVSKTTESEKTHTCESRSTPEFSSESRTRCTTEGFKQKGAGWADKSGLVSAPLLDHEDLAELLTRMSDRVTSLMRS